MQCVKCGHEIMGEAAFCPFCGEKVVQDRQKSDEPIYQADVKRPLRPAGKLVVYQDRTEFITSSVQKAIFNYAGLVSVKKGLLDNIEFMTEDGHIETCPADRKCVYEALVHIEQASRFYLAKRKERLLSQGVRYSFPSNQGIMSSGILNLSAEQAEFMGRSGKKDFVFYRDVKSVSTSGGMLIFSLFGGGSKSFAVSTELLDEVSAFVADSIAPYLAQRKEALLAQGIYFSSDSLDGGTLDILADRVEYKSRSGQTESCIYFQNIRVASLYGGTLELALTDGTSKSFPVEENLAAEILAFIKTAIEPYVAARTIGFDTAFGIEEQIEFNDERCVFHFIRQGGREITGEWHMENLIRCEWMEDKKLTALGSMVSGGIGLIKNMAKAAGSQTGTETEEKIGSVSVALTIRTDQDMQNQYICFGRSSVGMSRTDKKYEQCLTEWENLTEYLKARCPECELVEPVIPEPEPVLPEAGVLPCCADSQNAERADTTGAEAVPTAMDAVARRDDLGIAKYIEGVSRFIETCATPMTIALQGNRGNGKNSILGVLFDQMNDRCGGNLFWLSARQISKSESAEELAGLVGRTLIGLLGGEDNASKQAGSFLTGLAGLATGIIAGDTEIGKEIAGGVLNKNAPNLQEDLVTAFSKEIEAKTRGEDGKIIFFIDGMEQLNPAKAVDLLEAMEDFFACKRCVFVISANYDSILLGARERYDENKAKSFFDGVFKMTFRIPASSINIKNYTKGKLEAMEVQTENDAELEFYAALILNSIGRNLEAMDRLFVSFQLLRDMTGEDVYRDRYKRLLLFALLCMQTRFRDAYDYTVRRRDSITPEFLVSLCGESTQPWNKNQTDDEIAAYRDFSGIFMKIINLDDKMEISEAECQAFIEVLELSSVTSR